MRREKNKGRIVRKKMITHRLLYAKIAILRIARFLITSSSHIYCIWQHPVYARTRTTTLFREKHEYGMYFEYFLFFLFFCFCSHCFSFFIILNMILSYDIQIEVGRIKLKSPRKLDYDACGWETFISLSVNSSKICDRCVWSDDNAHGR